MSDQNIIDSLSPEQDAILDAVAQEYIDDINVYRPVDIDAAKSWLTIVYREYQRPMPSRVQVARSPYEACAMASVLIGERQVETDWCGAGERGWIARYDAYHRLGMLTDEEFSEVRIMREYQRTAWDTLTMDECAIVVACPTALRTDADGNLHGDRQPCIEWGDGEVDYAWHGVWLTEAQALRPEAITKLDFLAIRNTEVRRAICEMVGWAHVAELLGLDEVDTWTDPATGLRYSLLKGSDMALLKKQSPQLKNGSQPWYVEPVHEDLRTAQAARKWQATNLSPTQCEADPGLSYGVEA